MRTRTVRSLSELRYPCRMRTPGEAAAFQASPDTRNLRSISVPTADRVPPALDSCDGIRLPGYEVGRAAMIARSLPFALLLLVPAAVAAQEWPQWRGPNRDGVSTETGLLKEWPAGGPKLAWQHDQVGVGYSSLS